jgi:hypothetical protein
MARDVHMLSSLAHRGIWVKLRKGQATHDIGLSASIPWREAVVSNEFLGSDRAAVRYRTTEIDAATRAICFVLDTRRNCELVSLQLGENGITVSLLPQKF